MTFFVKDTRVSYSQRLSRSSFNRDVNPKVLTLVPPKPIQCFPLSPPSTKATTSKNIDTWKPTSKNVKDPLNSDTPLDVSHYQVAGGLKSMTSGPIVTQHRGDTQEHPSHSLFHSITLSSTKANNVCTPTTDVKRPVYSTKCFPQSLVSHTLAIPERSKPRNTLSHLETPGKTAVKPPCDAPHDVGHSKPLDHPVHNARATSLAKALLGSIPVGPTVVVRSLKIDVKSAPTRNPVKTWSTVIHETNQQSKDPSKKKETDPTAFDVRTTASSAFPQLDDVLHYKDDAKSKWILLKEESRKLALAADTRSLPPLTFPPVSYSKKVTKPSCDPSTQTNESAPSFCSVVSHPVNQTRLENSSDSSGVSTQRHVSCSQDSSLPSGSSHLKTTADSPSGPENPLETSIVATDSSRQLRAPHHGSASHLLNSTPPPSSVHPSTSGSNKLVPSTHTLRFHQAALSTSTVSPNKLSEPHQAVASSNKDVNYLADASIPFHSSNRLHLTKFWGSARPNKPKATESLGLFSQLFPFNQRSYPFGATPPGSLSNQSDTPLGSLNTNGTPLGSSSRPSSIFQKMFKEPEPYKVHNEALGKENENTQDNQCFSCSARAVKTTAQTLTNTCKTPCARTAASRFNRSVGCSVECVGSQRTLESTSEAFKNFEAIPPLMTMGGKIRETRDSRRALDPQGDGLCENATTACHKANGVGGTSTLHSRKGLCYEGRGATTLYNTTEVPTSSIPSTDGLPRTKPPNGRCNRPPASTYDFRRQSTTIRNNADQDIHKESSNSGSWRDTRSNAHHYRTKSKPSVSFYDTRRGFGSLSRNKKDGPVGVVVSSEAAKPDGAYNQTPQQPAIRFPWENDSLHQGDPHHVPSRYPNVVNDATWWTTLQNDAAVRPPRNHCCCSCHLTKPLEASSDATGYCQKSYLGQYDSNTSDPMVQFPFDHSQQKNKERGAYRGHDPVSFREPSTFSLNTSGNFGDPHRPLTDTQRFPCSLLQCHTTKSTKNDTCQGTNVCERSQLDTSKHACQFTEPTHHYPAPMEALYNAKQYPQYLPLDGVSKHSRAGNTLDSSFCPYPFNKALVNEGGWCMESNVRPPFHCASTDTQVCGCHVSSTCVQNNLCASHPSKHARTVPNVLYHPVASHGSSLEGIAQGNHMCHDAATHDQNPHKNYHAPPTSAQYHVEKYEGLRCCNELLPVNFSGHLQPPRRGSSYSPPSTLPSSAKLHACGLNPVMSSHGGSGGLPCSESVSQNPRYKDPSHAVRNDTFMDTDNSKRSRAGLCSNGHVVWVVQEGATGTSNGIISSVPQFSETDTTNRAIVSSAPLLYMECPPWYYASPSPPAIVNLVPKEKIGICDYRVPQMWFSKNTCVNTVSRPDDGFPSRSGALVEIPRALDTTKRASLRDTTLLPCDPLKPHACHSTVVPSSLENESLDFPVRIDRQVSSDSPRNQVFE